jgi:serine/threonine protein kinase
MANYPDFSNDGYQIEKILGRNTVGGRITYLATALKTQQRVVIKQYQFAQSGLSWLGYQTYRSEIKILSSLYTNHIPRYLDSFETKTGFCLVQEYKNAPSLEQSGPFSPIEIREIAINLLEILVYLQNQTPPIIHGDLKPENILVDAQDYTKLYLVDFGFARVGSGEVNGSNVVKGTLGFMPPEEMYNRTLTKASDLYSLGVTLICLLTQTPSVRIGELIDEKTSQLHYKHLLPKIHPQFVHWLERMVATSQSDRFANAQIALKALYPVPILPRNWSLN